MGFGACNYAFLGQRNENISGGCQDYRPWPTCGLDIGLLIVLVTVSVSYEKLYAGLVFSVFAKNIDSSSEESHRSYLLFSQDTV